MEKPLHPTESEPDLPLSNYLLRLLRRIDSHIFQRNHPDQTWREEIESINLMAMGVVLNFIFTPTNLGEKVSNRFFTLSQDQSSESGDSSSAPQP